MAKHLLSLIKKKGIGDLLLALSLLSLVLALIFYLVYGETEFNPTLSLSVLIPSYILLAVIVCLGAIGMKEGKFIAFLLSLYILIEYITSQVTYIVNVFVGIDGNSFTPVFLVAFIGYLATPILLLASYILTKRFDLLPGKEQPHEATE